MHIQPTLWNDAYADWLSDKIVLEYSLVPVHSYQLFAFFFLNQPTKEIIQNVNNSSKTTKIKFDSRSICVSNTMLPFQQGCNQDSYYPYIGWGLRTSYLVHGRCEIQIRDFLTHNFKCLGQFIPPCCATTA